MFRNFAYQNNFGDILPQQFVCWLGAGQPEEEYMLCGSVLQHATSRSVAWGCGFIAANSTFTQQPKKICSVRGPLSRAIVGLDCPEIFGDSGLIVSRYYQKEMEQQYDYGVVPHYADKPNPWLGWARSAGMNIIDIQSGFHNVVDEIRKCRRIISSSLHGLVVADSYGIPNIWARFSGDVYGMGFKFLDYLLGVKRQDLEPLSVVSAMSDTYQIDVKFERYNVPVFSIDAILGVCPLC